MARLSKIYNILLYFKAVCELLDTVHLDVAYGLCVVPASGQPSHTLGNFK